MKDNSRFKKWALYALIWIFLASCFTCKAYLEYQFEGNGPSWLAMFGWEGASWGIWGLLSIAIFRLTQRFPMDRKHWARYLPIYLVAAAILIPLHFVLAVATSRLWVAILYKPYGTFLTDLQTNVFSRITWRLFVFTIITIVCHGWDAQRRFRLQESKASILQVQLVQAQLEALKMQLHPHFLFNTLHSLSELIHRDVHAAEEVVVRLGDFLRLTLHDPGQHQVSLRKEMEFLECYLEIEKIRLQERLQIVINVEPALLDIPVPNLILQPIVENAVRHGIAPWSSTGTLEIRASRVDSVLKIEVQDNGPGFSTTLDPDSYFQKGLGLSNTRARLEKMYGSHHRLVFKNAPEGGLIVLLEIPVSTKEQIGT